MALDLSPIPLLTGLRAERHQAFHEGCLYMPSSSVQRAIEEITAEIQAGRTDGFKAVLEGCHATDNPRGSASTFIDRLIPFQKIEQGGSATIDDEAIGYYRTPPLITLELSKALCLKDSDTLIDIGGGNGTTSAIFALLNPQSKIVCLEFNEGLARQAQEIKEHLRIKNMSVAHEDAFAADLSSATVLYLYYPFNDKLFSRFVAKLDPLAMPDVVVNGNDAEILHNRSQLLSESTHTFKNGDISWWKGNLRG